MCSRRRKNRARWLDRDGRGNRKNAFAGDGGRAVEASFREIRGIGLDAGGNLTAKC